MGLEHFMSHREEATFILLGLLLVFVLTKSDLRGHLGVLVRDILLSKITPLFGLFAICVLIATWGAARAHIWNRGLVGAEAIWFFSAGFAWFMRLGDAGKHPDFFRKHLIEAIGIAAFMELFMNLATLSLIGELVLQVVLILLGGMIVVASVNEDQKPLVVPLRFIVGAITLTLAIYTVVWLSNNWDSLDRHTLLEQLLMPIWLAACAAICFYPIVLLMGYELLFLHMKWANNNTTPKIRARLGVMLELRGSWVKIHQLTGATLHEAARATTVRAARRAAARQLQGSSALVV